MTTSEATPAKVLAETIVPQSLHLPMRFNYLRLRGRIDPEMTFVMQLLHQRRRFIDVGANVGLYSYFYSAHFDYVDAFEPIREITGRLDALKTDNISTHPVALSRERGELEFRIPLQDGSPVPGLASLEPREPPFELRSVAVMKLDDFSFDDVDLIKIDVEGHELSVIEGARSTLVACQPVLIVEIEQRHSNLPISETFSTLEDLGYRGFYLAGRKSKQLVPIRHFSVEANQNTHLNKITSQDYVNNFVFIS